MRDYWRERALGRERLIAFLLRHWEIGLYLVIIGLAAGLRFWDLGARAFHHDESLHAFYSWKLYKGEGYEHDPMMHGPFEFFGTALIFRIWPHEATDFSARVWPALFGTALVGLPFFLRGYLGRTGALIAAAFLAFSPTLLYYSRFARNDIYIGFFTLALVVCMWRYLKERREIYLYLAAAVLALSFATKEVTFILVGIFLLYLDLLVTYDLVDRIRLPSSVQRAGRSRRRRGRAPPEEEGTPLSGGRRALAYAVLLPTAWLIAVLWPLLETPRRRFALKDELPASAHLLVLIGTLSLPQLAAMPQMLPFIGHKEIYDAPDEETLMRVSVVCFIIASAYVGLLWRWRVWLIAAAIFYTIFVLLYTSFFTNLGGFWSGIWGSLDYWLAQQDVRRGEQPDYYYFVLLPVYEFLPLIFALGGALWYAFRGKVLHKAISFTALALVLILTFTGIDPVDVAGFPIHIRFPIVIAAMLLLPMERFTQFLLFWMLAILFGLTVAGEKMPWLNVHLALPLAILAAKVLHDLLAGMDLKLKRVDVPPVERWAPFAYAGLAAALAVVVFIAVGPGSGASVSAWVLAVVAGGATLWAAYSLSIRVGAQVAAVALACALGVFTLRAGILASWGHPNLPAVQGFVATEDHGDTPVEVLVYTQSSPDIPVIRDWIDRLATTSGLGRDLPIEVDGTDGFSWPWAWYLRDYNVVGYPSIASMEDNYQAPTGTVLLIKKENVGRINIDQSQFEEGIPYRHRWWFPEHGTYRDLTVKDFFADLADPGTWDAWRGYFIDRKLVPELGSVDAVAYFPLGFEVSRPPTPAPALPTDTETVRVEDGQLVIGGLGAALGQLNEPAGLALDGEGNLYVADKLNRRIQKFGPDGHFLVAQGSAGSGPAQFGTPQQYDDGPWGLAADAQGNVYVADTWNHRIQKFDSDLNYVSDWGQPAADLENPGPYDLFGPRDIAIDAEGNPLVVDTGNKRILKFSPEGEHLATYGKGGSGPGEFSEPVGIVVGRDGEVYVADAWNQRIQHFDRDFNYLDEIHVEGWGGRGIADKPYIAVLGDGRVLATDPEHGRVLVFDPEGDLLAQWEAPAAGGRPVGIVVRGDGQVYVSDAGANQVRRLPLEAILGQ